MTDATYKWQTDQKQMLSGVQRLFGRGSLPGLGSDRLVVGSVPVLTFSVQSNILWRGLILTLVGVLEILWHIPGSYTHPVYHTDRRECPSRASERRPRALLRSTRGIIVEQLVGQ